MRKKDGPAFDSSIILAVGQSDSPYSGGKFHDESKLQFIRGFQRNGLDSSIFSLGQPLDELIRFNLGQVIVKKII